MTERFPIVFEPVAKRILSGGDEVLLQSARRAGVHIASSCGGQGRCRSCQVRIEGAVPEPGEEDRRDFSPEDLAAGWRRACRVHPVGPCTIHVPAKTAVPVFVEKEVAGAALVPVLDPVLRPSLQTGIWLHGEHKVGPVSGGPPLGLAVDLGTTNLEAALIDLPSGAVLACGGKENPQVVFGADVISRLTSAVRVDETAHELQHAAVSALAELADALTGWQSERIAEVAIVGNSVMQHLLLGLPISSLAHAPYIPNIIDSVDIPAADLGLKFAPGARLYFGPDIAGFIGSDHVAALLAVMSDPPSGRWALIDIGTNTEISLCVDGRLTSASCASGPAFEGGMLTCGMQAVPGAIQKVRWREDALELNTIAGADPVGICGSGTLSLLAELLKSGVINARGRLARDHPLVRERFEQLEFVLADGAQHGALPVIFAQNDVRAVQLAKGAIRAGLDLLLAEMQMREDELDHIILAGGFGTYLDVLDAQSIGLLPTLPRERFLQVGNAAEAGVRRLVACRAAREEAERLARRAFYLELATRPDFQKVFMRRVTL